jgi:hypothetical protein
MRVKMRRLCLECNSKAIVEYAANEATKEWIAVLRMQTVVEVN